MNANRTVVMYDEELGVNCTEMELIKPASSVTTIAGGGSDYNWLAKLPVGTRFLFKNRMPQNHVGPDIGVQYAEITVKYKECTKLFDGLNKPINYIVDNLAFSTQMRCVEIDETPEGVANALIEPSSDRTD